MGGKGQGEGRGAEKGGEGRGVERGEGGMDFQVWLFLEGWDVSMCWQNNLQFNGDPEMCFQPRDLRSEVFKEVQEVLEGDDDDVTSDEENSESTLYVKSVMIVSKRT